MGKITRAKAKLNKMSKHSTAHTHTRMHDNCRWWTIEQWERKKCESERVFDQRNSYLFFLDFFFFFFFCCCCWKKIRQPIIERFDLDLYSHSSNNDDVAAAAATVSFMHSIQFNSILCYILFHYLVYFSRFKTLFFSLALLLFIYLFRFLHHRCDYCVHCSTC